MNNPFEKRTNALLIGGIAAGVVLTGGLTWLLGSERGQATLRDWQNAVKEKGKDLLAGFLTDMTGVSKPATDVILD